MMYKNEEIEILGKKVPCKISVSLEIDDSYDWDEEDIVGCEAYVICVRVDYGGISGSSYLGGCLFSKVDLDEVMEMVNEHGMVDECVSEIAAKVSFILNDFKAS